MISIFGWMVQGAAIAATLTATPAFGQIEGAQKDSSARVVDSAAPLDRNAFIQRARAASGRYKSLDAAIADGYRKVGPDMPAMGEHWIRIRQILQRDVDLDRPPVLTYLRIDDRPVLTGVAYAVAVPAGVDPPPPPIEGASWHLHTGTIQEELLGHDHRGDQAGLAMIHAWIWTDNPAGLFAAENWALPFLRIGADVPPHFSPAAAKAVALVESGDYFLHLIEAVENPPPEHLARIRELIEQYRQDSRAILRNQSSEPQPLEAVWRGLWEDLRAHLSAESIRYLDHLARGG